MDMLFSYFWHFLVESVGSTLLLPLVAALIWCKSPSRSAFAALITGLFMIAFLLIISWRSVTIDLIMKTAIGTLTIAAIAYATGLLIVAMRRVIALWTSTKSAGSA